MSSSYVDNSRSRFCASTRFRFFLSITVLIVSGGDWRSRARGTSRGLEQLGKWDDLLVASDAPQLRALRSPRASPLSSRWPPQSLAPSALAGVLSYTVSTVHCNDDWYSLWIFLMVWTYCRKVSCLLSCEAALLRLLRPLAKAVLTSLLLLPSPNSRILVCE